MLAKILFDAAREIDRALAADTYPLPLRAEIVRVRDAMDALRARLPTSPLCVPGCLRAEIEGPGHAGACVEPPRTWPRIVR